jgi:hypothetical protein
MPDPTDTDVLDNDLPVTEPEVIDDDVTKPVVEDKPDPNAELRSAMTELAGTVRDIAKPKEKEQPLSEAEQKKLWAIYDPEETRKDFLHKFFKLNPDATPDEVKEAKDMWGSIQQGLVKQAVVGSINLTKNELAKLREEFGPALDYIQQARARETRSRFDTTYPTLADAKYGKIVQANAKLLEGKTFKDENEYFKVLAESTAESIKAIDATFDLGKKTETKPAGSTPKLPRTSVGGQGGTGAGSGKTKETPKGGDIDDLG